MLFWECPISSRQSSLVANSISREQSSAGGPTRRAVLPNERPAVFVCMPGSGPLVRPVWHPVGARMQARGPERRAAQSRCCNLTLACPRPPARNFLPFFRRHRAQWSSINLPTRDKCEWTPLS